MACFLLLMLLYLEIINFLILKLGNASSYKMAYKLKEKIMENRMKNRCIIVLTLLLSNTLGSCQSKFMVQPEVHDQSGKSLQENLQEHVEKLTAEIGVKNLSSSQCYENLQKAAAYIKNQLRQIGFKLSEGETYHPEYGLEMKVITYDAGFNGQLFPLEIVEATIHGHSEAAQPIVVIGAHYDTFRGGYEKEGDEFVFNEENKGSLGADDNVSSIAAMLEVASYMKQYKRQGEKTLRLLFFPNEEEPYSANFSDHMGSVQYAQRAKERGELLEVVVLECIGYYTNKPNSQSFPAFSWLFKLLGYPTEGNFVAFTSDWNSGELLKRCRTYFNSDKKAANFSTARLSLPNIKLFGIDIGRIVGRSDHKAFWDVHRYKNTIALWDIIKRAFGSYDPSVWGYPAIMISDTANFRNPHYHKGTDVSATLNYPNYACVVERLYTMTKHLIGVEPS